MLSLAACGDTQAPTTPGADVARTPEAPDLRCDQALKLIADGRLDQARALLESIVAERPELARPELLIGLAWHQQKDYARARPHLERAAAAGPVFERQAAAHYYLGWCLYYLGEPEGARASFARHLELDPSEGDSHFGLGLVALDAGLLDEAESRFRSAGELLARKMQQGRPALAREVAKCHARLADVHMLRERWAEAKLELEACLELHPAHYEAWYKLSVVHRRLGDETGAEEALRAFEQWKARARPAEVPR